MMKGDEGMIEAKNIRKMKVCLEKKERYKKE